MAPFAVCALAELRRCQRCDICATCENTAGGTGPRHSGQAQRELSRLDSRFRGNDELKQVRWQDGRLLERSLEERIFDGFCLSFR